MSLEYGPSSEPLHISASKVLQRMNPRGEWSAIMISMCTGFPHIFDHGRAVAPLGNGARADEREHEMPHTLLRFNFVY